MEQIREVAGGAVRIRGETLGIIGLGKKLLLFRNTEKRYTRNIIGWIIIQYNNLAIEALIFYDDPS